jgi:probable F420-dependent oxidoreductase
VTHPFRFAVRSSQIGSGRELREKARQAEDLGYYAYHVTDHVLGPSEAMARAGHPGSGLAVVPALMALADATSRVRLGSRVICVDYRHPVVLTNELATIDLFSEGRLEVGLGAGWLASEYEAIGVRFDPAPVRIARLGEAIRLMKLLFGDGPVSFHGDFFHADGFAGTPKPAQRPHPPFVIGGGGRRVLQLAGREADIVSLNYNNRSGVLGVDGVRQSSEPATRQKIQWIREEARGRFDQIQIDIGVYYTVVTNDAERVAENIGTRYGLTAREMIEHPHALIGSADGICEELLRRRQTYGVSYWGIGADAAVDFAPVVERLSGT